MKERPVFSSEEALIYNYPISLMMLHDSFNVFVFKADTKDVCTKIQRILSDCLLQLNFITQTLYLFFS